MGGDGKSPDLPGPWNEGGVVVLMPTSRFTVQGGWGGLSVASGPPGELGAGWRGAWEPGFPTSRVPGECEGYKEVSPFSQLTLTLPAPNVTSPHRKDLRLSRG